MRFLSSPLSFAKGEVSIVKDGGLDVGCVDGDVSMAGKRKYG